MTSPSTGQEPPSDSSAKSDEAAPGGGAPKAWRGTSPQAGFDDADGILLPAGLFVLSAAVLLLELLGMRLLSFMLWHHLAYMVLSIALLGFGAAGAILAWSRKGYDPRRIMIWSALLFAFTNLLSFAILSRMELDTFEIGPAKLFKLGFFYAMMLLPYFFAGVALAVLFNHAVSRVTSLYFVNMVGSGIGCYLFMVAIEPLGGPAALVLVSVLGAAAALLWSIRAAPKLMPMAGAGLLLALAAMPIAPFVFPFEAAPSKALARHLKIPGATVEFTRWTPLSRIDVIYAPMAQHPFLKKLIPGDQMRVITIDGDANTWMFRWPPMGDPFYEEYFYQLTNSSYAVAFHLKKAPKTLIIGAGGGNEIAIALHMGASHATGVELSPAILEQTVYRYADFTGRLYQSGRATPIVGEGRSFIRRSPERYDILQMSGVDTWSGLSSGAYVLSENYLYTVDADKEFLGHLTPDGILSIGRFLLQPPRETLRLVSNAVRALREIGVTRPQDHLIVFSLRNLSVARVLVKRSPFTRDEVATVEAMRDRPENQETSAIWYAPLITAGLKPNAFTHLVAAAAAGPAAEQAFYRSYPYDVTPVYDDRPFFFEYYKWRNLLSDLADGGKGGQIGANKPVGLVILLSLFLQVAILCVVFIFVPLYRMGEAGRALRAPLVLGMSALGMGFMFVEVGLMQKLVLFLGHPSYSISVTLFSILIASGLGSLAAGRWRIEVRTKLLVATVAIGFFMILYMVLLESICVGLLGLPLQARIALAGALVALPAFFMGMPFPLSLKEASALSTRAVPWAWGINGGASVLGSILCIFVAMGLGFRYVFLFAALLYLVAYVTLARLGAAKGRGWIFPP